MAAPTFTGQQVLDRVRAIKSDASYSSATALLWITDAVIELYTQCPKSRRVESDGTIREYSLITDIGAAVPCEIWFMPLIVDYVVARAFMEDSDSQEHRQRAAEHFKLFFDRAQLIQTGLPFRQTPAPVAGAVR